MPLEADESTSPPWQTKGYVENLLNPHLKATIPEDPSKSRNPPLPHDQELDVWKTGIEKNAGSLYGTGTDMSRKIWLEERLFTEIGKFGKSVLLLDFMSIGCDRIRLLRIRYFFHECNSLRPPFCYRD
jgi:hypothetical protein